ncbi:peptidase, S41 family [Segatella baroniae F0067]|uniref:Peptidase, S41 family n=2 Tax=Segatella baroniae TaxID=305719 RepID=U2NQ70_9BACT|nr:peptidase, S41 family [Segatella baroniae F0067]
MKMRQYIIGVLLVLALPVAAQEKDDHRFEVMKNLDVFNSIYKQLDLLYVDTLDPKVTIGAGIDAMLSSLDPYTEYYPAEKKGDFKMMVTGKYAGIGSLIRYDFSRKNVVIEEPYANMPAAEAGLKKGDVILAIDDQSMEGRDNSYVSDRLRGDAGTTFVIKIRRPSTGKVMKIKVTRRAIQLPSVPYYGLRQDGVGYINLNQFTEGCAQQVRRAFLDLKGKGMKKLVLDLRGNGGGVEQEAVSLVNMFVPKGKLIVSNRGRLKRMNNDYRTTVEPIDTVMPIVVLVNGETASSSEITSGSLQDLDRAVVMGTRTYGKGLVQMTMPMPYNGSLKLTTNKYYIPSGRCIQAINYKHNNGGYTEHVPDSLTKEFRTAGGRVVKDGGGITPDVEVKPDTLSNLTISLLNSSPYMTRDSSELLLNYVVDYIAKHPTVAAPKNFELTDADYEAFAKRVVDSGYTYARDSEKYLRNLEKLARFEGYYDEAKPEFEALKAKLSHNLAKDLRRNKQQLMEILAKEILPSYYYQAGTIEYGLKHDKTFDEAVKLLGDSDRYRKILHP